MRIANTYASIALGFAVLGGAASAWEFSPNPVCTLTHIEPQLEMRVTYDPVTKVYAIDLTKPEPWPEAPQFSIQFDGPRALTISTDRHRLSDQGLTLTVTDTGFGNVLNGLQYNTTATARTGNTEVSVSLDGAAEQVEAFRACSEALAV